MKGGQGEGQLWRVGREKGDFEGWAGRRVVLKGGQVTRWTGREDRGRSGQGKGREIVGARIEQLRRVGMKGRPGKGRKIMGEQLIW